MTQVTLYLDAETTTLLTQGAEQAQKSKSRFLADLLRATQDDQAERSYRAELDAVFGLAADAVGAGNTITDDWPDFDAIRREMNAVAPRTFDLATAAIKRAPLHPTQSHPTKRKRGARTA